ncbi:MAG TPA: cupin domain-containing protein [Kofleriaceae bacterium]
MSEAITESNQRAQVSTVLRLQEEMRKLPQVELATFHYFADGMYARVVPRAAGTTIVGKVHKREHFYIITKGSVKVWSDGETRTYVAGDVIVSRPGTKRAVYALEDSICMTVHRTNKKNLKKIERDLVEPDELALFDETNTVKRLS